MSPSARPMRKLLLINPNTSEDTTQMIAHKLSLLPPSDIFEIVTYTAPSGPKSIDTTKDEDVSAKIVFEDISPQIDDYDAFLVASYSLHPLVDTIKNAVGPDAGSVMGIFEASIIAGVAMLGPAKQKSHHHRHFYRFGIVTTTPYAEESLTNATLELLKSRGTDTDRFDRVQSIGFLGDELETANPELVEQRVKDATRRLVHKRQCGVVILGCAGMTDMEPIVREAILEELGDEERFVHITDGVSAGIGMLEGIQEGKDGF